MLILKKNKNYYLTISIIFIYFFISLIFIENIEGQILREINKDTLNQYNESGQKSGYWIELLNKSLIPVKKEEDAQFYHLVYYENGERRSNFNNNLKKVNNLEIDGNKAIQNEIVLLNGKYKLYSNENKLLCEKEYSKGIKIGVHKTYNTLTGEISEYENFNKKYKGQNKSYFLMYCQDHKGNFDYMSYYRNGEKGWNFYYYTNDTLLFSEKDCSTLIFYGIDYKPHYQKWVKLLINDSLKLDITYKELITIYYPETSIKIYLLENKKTFYFEIKEGEKNYFRLSYLDNQLIIKKISNEIAENEIKEKKITKKVNWFNGIIRVNQKNY
jgi:hypothetical protein